MINSFTQPPVSSLPTNSELPNLNLETQTDSRSSKGRLILIVGSILVTLILLAISLQLFLNLRASSQQSAVEKSAKPPMANVNATERASDLPELSPATGSASARLMLTQTAGASPSQYKTDTPATTSITLQSNEPSQEIDGVELVIAYDPSRLKNVRLQPTRNTFTIIRNEVDSVAGTISLTAIRQATESITAGEGMTIGTISFTPIQSGETIFSFDTDATLVAGNGGSNILEQAENLRILVE